MESLKGNYVWIDGNYYGKIKTHKESAKLIADMKKTHITYFDICETKNEYKSHKFFI